MDKFHFFSFLQTQGDYPDLRNHCKNIYTFWNSFFIIFYSVSLLANSFITFSPTPTQTARNLKLFLSKLTLIIKKHKNCNVRLQFHLHIHNLFYSREPWKILRKNAGKYLFQNFMILGVRRRLTPPYLWQTKGDHKNIKWKLFLKPNYKNVFISSIFTFKLLGRH